MGECAHVKAEHSEVRAGGYVELITTCSTCGKSDSRVYATDYGGAYEWPELAGSVDSQRFARSVSRQLMRPATRGDLGEVAGLLRRVDKQLGDIEAALDKRISTIQAQLDEIRDELLLP